jgi:transcriptional regulator with XRE-family HTH domain
MISTEWRGVMSGNILKARRKKLGIPIAALARLSGVSVPTVNRILRNPGTAQFGNVAAVGKVLGIDFRTARKVRVETLLQARALQKARYVARVVQGTQGLEAAGVDADGYERLVNLAAETLLAGKKRKLWDED